MRRILKILFVKFIFIYFRINEKIRNLRIHLLIKKIYKSDCPFVLLGPFEGMQYLSTACGSQLMPKLLGTYEEPIQEIIKDIIERQNYTAIVDVGCAEGYYAVGLAMFSKAEVIYAYDLDEEALSLAQRLAKINHVTDKIRFSSEFNPTVLSNIVRSLRTSDRLLLFVDVEGSEMELLDPSLNPSVLSSDILVELHECFRPGVTQKIKEYFNDTHDVVLLEDYCERKHAYNKIRHLLSVNDFNFSIDERRPSSMSWLYARRI